MITFALSMTRVYLLEGNGFTLVDTGSAHDYPEIQVIARTEAPPLLAAGRNNTANGGSLLNRRIKTLRDLKRRFSPGWDLRFSAVRFG